VSLVNDLTDIEEDRPRPGKRNRAVERSGLASARCRHRLLWRSAAAVVIGRLAPRSGRHRALRPRRGSPSRCTRSRRSASRRAGLAGAGSRTRSARMASRIYSWPPASSPTTTPRRDAVWLAGRRDVGAGRRPARRDLAPAQRFAPRNIAAGGADLRRRRHPVGRPARVGLYSRVPPPSWPPWASCSSTHAVGSRLGRAGVLRGARAPGGHGRWRRGDRRRRPGAGRAATGSPCTSTTIVLYPLAFLLALGRASPPPTRLVLVAHVALFGARGRPHGPATPPRASLGAPAAAFSPR